MVMPCNRYILSIIRKLSKTHLHWDADAAYMNPVDNYQYPDRTHLSTHIRLIHYHFKFNFFNKTFDRLIVKIQVETITVTHQGKQEIDYVEVYAWSFKEMIRKLIRIRPNTTYISKVMPFPINKMATSKIL